MKILETERTIIETIKLSDASFFAELVNTPDWLRFIGDRQVRNTADAEKFLQNGLLKSFDENGWGYYLIRTKSGEPIGTSGFMKKPYLEHEDFGFGILPKFYGQGYASEACGAILKFGIEQIGLQIIDAATNPENTRSKKLLERFGFILQGQVTSDELDVPLELYRLHI